MITSPVCVFFFFFSIAIINVKPILCLCVPPFHHLFYCQTRSVRIEKLKIT